MWSLKVSSNYAVYEMAIISISTPCDTSVVCHTLSHKQRPWYVLVHHELREHSFRWRIDSELTKYNKLK